MRKKLPNISEGIETLKAEMHKTSDVHRNQKLTMLYHLKSGYAKTRREAASLIGVHPKTVGTWLTVYETDGLEAMLHRGTPTGRPPLLTPAQPICYGANSKRAKGSLAIQLSRSIFNTP